MDDTEKLNILVAAKDAASDVLGRVSHSVTSFGQKTEKTTGALHGLGGKASALLAPLGLLGISLAGVFELHSAVDQTTKLGIAVDKLRIQFGLSAEQGSALIAVADNVHVEAETLEKGFKSLTKNIGNYRAGVVDGTGSTDAFSKTLKQLNIHVLDSKKHTRDLNDIFLESADRISKMSNEEERAAAATALFGKAGIDLLPVLTLGKQGILEAEAEAKRYGLTLNDQTLPKIREFADKMNNLNDVVSGLKIKIGLLLIPVLSAMAEKVTGGILAMQDWISRNPAVIASLQHLGEAGVAFVTRALGALIQVIGGKKESAADRLGLLDRRAGEARSSTDDLATSIQQVADRITAFLNKKSTKDLIAFFQQVKDVVNGLGDALQRVADLLNGIVARENDIGAAVRAASTGGPGTPGHNVRFGHQYAQGGYTGEEGGVVHPHEYVVPERGALVMHGASGGAPVYNIDVYGNVDSEDRVKQLGREFERKRHLYGGRSVVTT